MADFQITIDVENVIGRGNNLVFKGTINAEPCVVKRVIKPVGHDMMEMIAKGKREIDIWKELSNSPVESIPIVRCFGSKENSDFWYMACEEFEGDLYKLIRLNDPFANADLSALETLKELSLQAAQGLAFVHGEIDGRNISYVHKDIKPSNFVVRRGGLKGKPVWICKLTDFGNAKKTIQGGSQCRSTTRFGTRDWMAPEVITEDEDEAHRFTKKSDAWSMGCMIHFIFTRGQHPYGDRSHRTENIRLGQPTQAGQTALVQTSKPELRVDDLVGKMIQLNPNDRPTMQHVVQTIQQWTVPEELGLVEQ